MSELPGRPDLDQLRRQARELLRAATDGEPEALARLSAVSERVTLSAAQLAVAREYGCPSWPALRAEVERRRQLTNSGGASLPGGDGRVLDLPEDRWSFGGATAIETSAGKLCPQALLVSPSDAVLDASLMPAGNDQPGPRPRRLLVPGMPFARLVPRGRARTARLARRRRAAAAVATMRALTYPDDVTVVDDQGARYALRPGGMSGKRRPSGEPGGPISVRLRLEPVPERQVKWLELGGQDATATRLLPSAHAAVLVGQLAPVVVSPAERELSDQALWLIELQLTSAGLAEDFLRQRCAAALARTAEIQRSGGLDRASELPDQLRQLCGVLTEHRPADGLPGSWSGMLDAAQWTDGTRRHFDIRAALPPIDGVAVQLDSLVSLPDSWRLYVRARPGWWNKSEDGRRKWNPVSVHAEDDRGGAYLSTFGGSTGHSGHEELALRFLPRLDPLARALTLTCRGAGEQVVVELGLVPAATP